MYHKKTKLIKFLTEHKDKVVCLWVSVTQAHSTTTTVPLVANLQTDNNRVVYVVLYCSMVCGAPPAFIQFSGYCIQKQISVIRIALMLS